MVWGLENLRQKQAALCVVWGPNRAVGLSWRDGGGVGFSDPWNHRQEAWGVGEAWGGGRRGRARTGRKEGTAFPGEREEIKHLLKQVLGTLLGAKC